MLLKKYELTYDTIYKSNNITMNFNEFDVDTSDFVVTVTRKGVQVDLKGSIATIAVIKPNSSVDAQFIDVIDTSKLYCDLKSNMKNLPGTYEAMIMISNNGEHISIGPVKYFVQDNKPFAQLDSSISDDTRLTIVQELLDKLQPIYNTELQRIANEEDRLKAEELRKSLEILRIEAEELRVNNENTRVQSESTRVSSENVRIESENFRVANENTREINEATRVASEVSRASSEKIRENSEGDRLEAENTRQANEKNRVLNESQRQQNESDRVVNETQRVQNESNRQYFEEKRVEAELVRKQWYDKAFEGSEKMSVDEATRVENEAQRVNAETLRIQRESDRVTQETKREQQEVSRTSKENERLQAETTRQSNEGTRQSNESDRVAKESSRVQVEQSRVNAEKLRATNETTRINSEQTRADNEKARVLAEQQRITEHQAREELLSGYDSRLASIENINETNTIRLNEMDRVNRNQAIAIQGLINEHSDKRISLTEDTHNINLDYATKGILEVDSIEGETLVNVSDQKENVPISKAYNVEGTNHIALQGEIDGKARPNIHGNTMVNVSSQKEKAPITLKYDDILGNEGKLLVGDVVNKAGHVEIAKITGNTLVNVANQKELVPITKKYDDIIGNEGKLLVGDVANKKGHVEIDKIVGNTLVNIHPASTSSFNAGDKSTNSYDIIADTNYIKVSGTNLATSSYRYIKMGRLKVSMFKPSTTYTIVFTKLKGIGSIMLMVGDSTNAIHSSTVKCIDNKLIYTITTTDKTFEDNGQILYLWIDPYLTTLDIEVENPMIFEGDLTTTPDLIPNSYIEGLQSSFESNLVTQEMVTQGLESEENLGKYKVPIKVVGKNLAPTSSYTQTLQDIGFVSTPILGSKKSIPSNSKYISYSYEYEILEINVPQQKFISNLAGSTNKGDGATFDINNTVITSSIYVGSKGIVSVKNLTHTRGYGIADIRFLRFTDTSVICKYKITNFILCVSDSPIVEDLIYEDYFERTTNVYLNSPLLKNDEIVMHDGELCHYHKCKEEILDGNDGRKWLLGNSGTTTSNRFFTDNFNDNFASDIICDKLCTMNGWAIEYAKCIRLSNTALNIYIPSTECGVTVDEFKTWLQTNQLRVVYELAEPWYEPIQADKLLLECANNSTLHLDTVVPVENISFKSYEEELNYLYTSKVYTVQFNADSTGTCDITLGGAKLLNQSVKKGLNKFNITTLSTLVDNKLIINGEGFNVEEVAVVDTESNFDYFEGLESSFECNLVTQEMVDKGLENAENLGKYKVPIKLVGKNKFDGELESGSISIDGTKNENSYVNECRSKNYILVNSNTNHIISGYTSSDNTIIVWEYDKNKNCIGYKYIALPTFTTSNNTRYIRFRIVSTDLSQRIQIEEGTVATDYEEYFERIANIYLNSPLLEGDEIVMKDGELCHYHKKGSGVLDSNIGFSMINNTAYSSDILRFDVDSQYRSLFPVITGLDSTIICDKFPYTYIHYGNLSIVRNQECISNHSSNVGEISVLINKSKLSTEDSSGFKQWLQSNPITVVYSLAEPYYEQIQADKLLLECANDSTIYVDTIVPVESVSFKAYEEELKYLYTSKDYKVKFESDAIGTCDITLGGTKLVSQSIKVGINEFSITTPATLTDNKLVIEGEGFNIERVSVVDTLLDFDYFEGMYSCFENQLVTDESDPNFGKYKVDYKVTGKNKCPVSSYSRQATKWSDTLVQLDSVVYKNIKISPTSKYIVSANDSTDTLKVIAHYTPLPENVTTHSGVYTIAIKEGGIEQKCGLVITGYNYISLTTGGYYSISKIPENTLVEYTNIQIEEGIEATTYEPYKEYIKTLYLNSPLLKGDTIEEINGKTTHVRRSYIGILDKFANLNKHSASTDGTLLIQWWLSKPKPKDDNDIKTDSIFFNHKRGWIYPYLIYSSGGTILFSLPTSDFATLDDFKNWLSNKSIKVMYELETPIYETISEDNRIIDSYVNGHLDLDSNVPVKKVDFRAWGGKLKYLYPSTTYTVQFVSDIDTKVNITLGGSLLSSQLATKGLNKLTIQTPATIDANEVRVDGIGANISKVLVTNSTREFNYFEGLKSSFEDNVTEEGRYKVPVKLIGKNLFNINIVTSWKTDSAIGSHGGIYSLAGDSVSNIFEIPKNLRNKTLQDNLVCVAVYRDKDESTMITRYYNESYTIPQEANYMRIECATTKKDTIQIEEGTVATSYEKYYEYNASVLLNSPLLKGDELVMKDGELCHYHKRSKVVLDGSKDEGIQFATTWSSNADIVIFTSSITSNVAYADKNKNYLIADNVLTDTYNQWVVYKNGVNKISVQESSTSGNRLLWSLPKDEYTLDSFKQKLQSSPTTIVYELAEPWYEPIQIGKIMLECINNSIFTIDTDLPVKSSINYSASIPSVQAMSNDINSLQDTSVDIITSSWDTDYRLSEVEWILEDNGLLSPMMFNLETKSTRGGTSMAFTKFEQAKIMILAGAYDREVLTKQLQRYLEKGVITKTEYEDLIALMDANELVAGK